ncbi:MAG: hypothetical protein HXS54_10110 [Theionarchaea archaeon]|nr:hypothetical protein [Theionarchaea archaeon]
MFKSLLILFTLLLSLTEGGVGYEVSFIGGDLGPVRDISVTALDGLYLAYTPPDENATVVVSLSQELQERSSIRIDGLISPCIKAYHDMVYLTGIENEDIVILGFNENLEMVKDFRFSVEEPTHVYIFPYKEGILLSYVHRFLEDGLLRQDVFLKKLDFSFNELTEVRLTNWDYWEDPCIVVNQGLVFVSYAIAPLYGFLDRHVVITVLDSNLEVVGSIRYPKDASEGKNVVQPDMAVVDEGVTLFCRMTDLDFSYTRFTWEGKVQVIPGNIQALKINKDLAIEKEFAITSDYEEHYEPCGVAAFGRIYFAYSVDEEGMKKVQVIYAETMDQLKIEPPQEKSYTWVVIGVVVIGLVVVGLIVNRLRGKKAKKKRK